MKTLPIAVVVVLLLYGIGVTVLDYLSLPVVAVNYSGECQWIQIATRHGVERRVCPSVLPTRYDRLPVSTTPIGSRGIEGWE